MSPKPFNFPIAETFFSLQGEGLYTGVPMFFVRLAGCNVGRNIGSVYTECTSWCGEKFTCDTDYRPKAGNMTAVEIVRSAHMAGAKHLCLTGGEPILYPVAEISAHCQQLNLHIETSGTKLIPSLPASRTFITCSPKQGYLAENDGFIDQWKFLIGPDTKIEAVEYFLRGKRAKLVYLQPITEKPEEAANTNYVIQILLRKHPEWRLSCQLHKYLGLS
jgi:7-carboxy-7-deazaguanine synthase